MRRAIFVALVVCGLLGLSARAGDDPQQSFPLSPGTYWIYHGLVRSFLEGSTIGKVTQVNWKMSVVRVVERGDVTAALVSGFPGDLDWSDGNVQPTLSILMEARGAKFYLNSSDSNSVIRQIDDPKYALGDLLDEHDWFLQLPLAEGEKFCEKDSMGRDDGMYCWVVGAPHPAALDGVKGVAAGNRLAYQVQYTTNPDDMEFDFVPGVGITSYEYHHHGTLAETELHLVEFHPAGESPAK